MGKAEIESFLTHLAVERNVAASTQNQALNAIIFLYRDVLDIPWFRGHGVIALVWPPSGFIIRGLRNSASINHIGEWP